MRNAHSGVWRTWTARLPLHPLMSFLSFLLWHAHGTLGVSAGLDREDRRTHGASVASWRITYHRGVRHTSDSYVRRRSKEWDTATKREQRRATFEVLRFYIVGRTWKHAGVVASHNAESVLCRLHARRNFYLSSIGTWLESESLSSRCTYSRQ